MLHTLTRGCGAGGVFFAKFPLCTQAKAASARYPSPTPWGSHIEHLGDRAARGYNAAVNRRTRFGPLAVLALIAIGCGGGGSDPTPTTQAHPYAGHWSGTFQDQIPVNGRGTLALTVDDAGRFSGGGTNTLKHADFTVSGQFDPVGNVSGSMSSGGQQADLTGQLVVDARGIGGTVTVAGTGSTSQLHVELAR